MCMAWIDIQSYNNLEPIVFELRWIENVIVTLFPKLNLLLADCNYQYQFCLINRYDKSKKMNSKEKNLFDFGKSISFGILSALCIGPTETLDSFTN